MFLPAQLPAWIFIATRFLVQLVDGLGSLADTGSAAGDVAYFAHVGGFVTGLLLVRLFAQPEQLQRLWAYHLGQR